jgi:hypothetical protein
MVHEQVPVVFGRKSHFGSEFPSLNSRKIFPLVVPNPQNKRMNSKLLALHNELGKDQSIIRNHPQLSWPELTRSDIRRMQLDLTGFLNKRSHGLQRLHIRPMANLCLRITPNHFILPPGDDKLFALLFSPHNLYTLDEHS